jgi:hypothetical protein
MCGFVNWLFKLNIYVLSSRFKEFRYSENDLSSFIFHFFKIETLFVFVFGGTIVKMNNFHLFWKGSKNFCFTHKRQWVMKSINNMVFFLTCTCVLMLLWFDKNDTSQEIYMFTNFSIFSFVCTPYKGAFLSIKFHGHVCFHNFGIKWRKKFKNIPKRWWSFVICLQKQDVLWL